MGLLERLLPIGPPPRWMGPPAMVPSLVGEVLVLAHTSTAAVAITGLGCYPTGFTFNLRVVLHREMPFSRRVDPFVEMHRRPGRPGSPPPEFLRLSVQFAGGSTISNQDSLPYAEPAGPLLVDNGGVSDRRRHDLWYWVWRLPPPGPVTLFCGWPACEIEDARGQIDAQLIRDAAARSIDPWPGDS